MYLDALNSCRRPSLPPDVPRPASQLRLDDVTLGVRPEPKTGVEVGVLSTPGRMPDQVFSKM